MDTLTKQLRKFIVDNFLFGVESQRFAFTDDDSFQQRGIVDSTGILELVCHLQEHYGLVIEDHELSPENLDSISRIANFIERKRAEQPAVVARAR